MHRKMLMMASILWVVASVGFAQEKPNFSGTWKLNIGKSDFGPVPGPNSQTDVIEQKEDAVTISVTAVSDEGTKQYTIKYVTDGQEKMISSDSPGAHPVADVTMQSLTAAWDGPVLVVNQKLLYGDAPVTGVSRYSLSADGKVLTVDSSYSSQEGDATRTFVYDRADSATAGAASQAKASSTAGAAAAASSGMAAASTAASATTSERPNLSGTWVLDVAKSDFGEMPPPDSRTDTIEHKDPSIKITVDQAGEMGEMNFTMDLITDGSTVSKWTVFGNEAHSTAHWEGDTLVVKTDTKFQDDPVSFMGKYTLSPDGKTLNVQDHFSGPMGEGDAKLVFNKQS
jgi:hypothetical protein